MKIKANRKKRIASSKATVTAAAEAFAAAAATVENKKYNAQTNTCERTNCK